MSNINDAFPSAYLKAADLGGRPCVVTIAGVEFEPVGKEKELKAVIHFVGKKKGMVCNVTNARKITELTGSPMTEEWIGHAIVIYPTETTFGGDVVDCVRVKAVAKAKAAMPRMTPKPKAEVAIDESEFDGDVDDFAIPF